MLKTKKYNFSELTSMTLDGMYEGDFITLKNLDKNLISIIETEAPITLNTLKQRLRTAFNVKKISQKALDIIEEHINKLGFYITDNLYDKVYWPRKGQFKIDYLRVDGDRLIYDIPYIIEGNNHKDRRFEKITYSANACIDSKKDNPVKSANNEF